MEKYLSVEELLAEAANRGVDFGKGDPYNRLRYYTKMGWISHMTRMKEDDGKTKGHYPESTIDRLVLIQKYKEEGISNEEIERRLAMQDKTKSFYSALASEEVRKKMVLYGIFIMVIIILIAELGIIQIGKPKTTQLIIQGTQTNPESQVQIGGAGTAFVPQNSQTVVVQSPNVTETAKVYVSFKDDYAPATRFWVSEQIPGESFTVELDAPTANNAEFDWWVTE